MRTEQEAYRNDGHVVGQSSSGVCRDLPSGMQKGTITSMHTGSRRHMYAQEHTRTLSCKPELIFETSSSETAKEYFQPQAPEACVLPVKALFRNFWASYPPRPSYRRRYIVDPVR